MNNHTPCDTPDIEMSYQEMKALDALFRQVYADSIIEYYSGVEPEPPLVAWKVGEEIDPRP